MKRLGILVLFLVILYGQSAVAKGKGGGHSGHKGGHHAHKGSGKKGGKGTKHAQYNHKHHSAEHHGHHEAAHRHPYGAEAHRVNRRWGWGGTGPGLVETVGMTGAPVVYGSAQPETVVVQSPEQVPSLTHIVYPSTQGNILQQGVSSQPVINQHSQEHA